MRRPPLPPSLAWFLTRSEIDAAIGGHSDEVSLHWLGRHPPHEVPLRVQWEPRRGFTGPIHLFVGSVTSVRRPEVEIDVVPGLNRWIDDALSASLVWQSQRHECEWRISDDGSVVSELDLDPSKHQV